jgi:GDP-L-fucose synthase
MSFWKGKKVVLAGGAGFIGSHVTDLLIERGAQVTIVDRPVIGFPKNLEHVKHDIEFVPTDLFDLTDVRAACHGQEIIFCLAARTGSIDFNKRHPGVVFHDSVRMSLNMLEAARLEELERSLVVSSSCVYPQDAPEPTPESAGFLGDPEGANFGYGWAKRVAEIQARTYAEEFGMNIAIARPYNGYGPRDHFDPAISHVVAALIKRVVDGDDPVVVWGDGEQIRTFLYVKDFARGLIEACEKYAVCDPLNIGSSEETRIKDLAEMIVRLSGRRPSLRFDSSKPGGQPRRTCDTTKAKEKIGFEAKYTLEAGLRETIEWYAVEFGL